jgi:hypothetical protein
MMSAVLAACGGGGSTAGGGGNMIATTSAAPVSPRLGVAAGFSASFVANVSNAREIAALPNGDLLNRIGRPTGIAVGAQGSLFIADDQTGNICRMRPMAAGSQAKQRRR